MAEIKTYEAIFDESVKGVFGISLVENPAMQEYFVQLKEQEKVIQFATINEEKRILLGLVLEPNKPVYRNDNGEEFYIVFGENTVYELAHAFVDNNNQHNSTIEHNDKFKIKGVSFVENWIIDDPNRDKTNVYNLKYAKGSWCTVMKVNSDEVWNDYIKTGKVKGFSIDAVVKLKEVNNKSDIKMAKNEKLTKFKDYFIAKFSKPKEAVVKFGQVNMEGGEIIFEFDGDVMQVGGSVFAVDPNDPENKIPVPTGEYKLEDGATLIVKEEGIIAEVKPAEAAPATPAPDAQMTPAPVPMAETQETVSQTVNDIKSILIKYEENFNKMAEMEKTIGELKSELQAVKKEVVEFGEQPITKPVTSMAEIKLNKQGRILAALRNN